MNFISQEIPDGWRMESRPVQVGLDIESPIYRDICCKGDHNEFCHITDDGWMCDQFCQVSDMIQAVNFENVVDDLLEVEETIKRYWFVVKWKMTRVSMRRKFVNGRCMDQDMIYSREVWHQGKTRTKWGARRQMKQYA